MNLDSSVSLMFININNERNAENFTVLICTEVVLINFYFYFNFAF